MIQPFRVSYQRRVDLLPSKLLQNASFLLIPSRCIKGIGKSSKMVEGERFPGPQEERGCEEEDFFELFQTLSSNVLGPVKHL